MRPEDGETSVPEESYARSCRHLKSWLANLESSTSRPYPFLTTAPTAFSARIGVGLTSIWIRSLAVRCHHLQWIDTDDGLRRLGSDLDNGAWHKRYADLLDVEALEVGYRLLRWDIK